MYSYKDRSKPNKPNKVNKESNKKISKIKSNLINNSSISKYNKTKLLSHGIHHTKKHITFMINQLNKGKTFKFSHTYALKNSK